MRHELISASSSYDTTGKIDRHNICIIIFRLIKEMPSYFYSVPKIGKLHRGCLGVRVQNLNACCHVVLNNVISRIVRLGKALLGQVVLRHCLETCLAHAGLWSSCEALAIFYVEVRSGAAVLGKDGVTCTPQVLAAVGRVQVINAVIGAITGYVRSSQTWAYCQEIKGNKRNLYNSNFCLYV